MITYDRLADLAPLEGRVIGVSGGCGASPSSQRVSGANCSRSRSTRPGATSNSVSPCAARCT